MSFSARLAEMVRRYQRAADDVNPADCECQTGFTEQGAWIFTCRVCFEAGLDRLQRECAVEADEPSLFD